MNQTNIDLLKRIKETVDEIEAFNPQRAADNAALKWQASKLLGDFIGQVEKDQAAIPTETLEESSTTKVKSRITVQPIFPFHETETEVQVSTRSEPSMRVETIGRDMTIKNLPNGSLFRYKDTIALKSDYRTDIGACVCYIVGSGKTFSAGTKSEEELNNLYVTPIVWMNE